MAVNDIYQATLFGTYLSQQVINVFFYRQFGAGAPPNVAEELYTQLADTLFDVAAPLRTTTFMSTMIWTGMRVTNLFDDDEFFDGVFSPVFTGGNTTSEGMPAYVSYYLRSAWLGPGIRRAMKRFAGVPEASAVNGVVGPSNLTVLNTLAAQLGAVLDPGGLTFTPIVVKRVKIPVVGTVPQQYIYRLPTNLSEADASQAVDWSASNQLSTQNSRKIGRGL